MTETDVTQEVQDRIKRLSTVTMSRECARVLANVLLRNSVCDMAQHLDRVLKGYHDGVKNGYLHEVTSFILDNK